VDVLREVHGKARLGRSGKIFRMESLHAPWRMEYIRSLEKNRDNVPCFLCQAAEADESKYKALQILWKTELSIVLLNLFPYTNGHLLVAPMAHEPEMENLSTGQAADLQVQTIAAIKLLKRAMSPQGFNVGINVGKCAGAGLPGHIHQHIVPRWAGDTNFISVVGDVRVVPEAISKVYDELVDTRKQMTS
jgi:ATP adenylyltransferase